MGTRGVGKLLAAALALGAVLGQARDDRQPVLPPKEVREVLGDKVSALLAEANRVEAFRIAPERQEKPRGQHISGYPVVATGKVPAGFLERLRQVLYDPKTYTGNSAKCFDPGVAFRVWKKQE